MPVNRSKEKESKIYRLVAIILSWTVSIYMQLSNVKTYVGILTAQSSSLLCYVSVQKFNVTANIFNLYIEAMFMLYNVGSGQGLILCKFISY